jgi:hypothetical protein
VRRRGAVRAMGNMRAGPEEMLSTKGGGHDFGRVTDGREEDGWPMVEKKADTRHRAGWSCTREHTINVLGTFINIYIMVIVNA